MKDYLKEHYCYNTDALLMEISTPPPPSTDTQPPHYVDFPHFYKKFLIPSVPASTFRTYGSSNATYYGKNKRHFKVQICEHLGILHLTGKEVKMTKNKVTTIQEHVLCRNCTP